MQKAETVLGLYLVSHWRAVMRSKDSRPVRGGAVGKVPQGNSLAAYSTASTVLRGAGCSNALLLPGGGRTMSDSVPSNEKSAPDDDERTRLTPELLEWARQLYTEEDIVAALREVREKGG